MERFITWSALTEVFLGAAYWLATYVIQGAQILLAATGVQPTPREFPDAAPAIPIARDIAENGAWLARQQVSVWFAIVVILFGIVIHLIIRHLLKSIDLQRSAHREEVQRMREDHAKTISEMRDQFAKVQIEEKGMSVSLLQYLEKDHSQTVVLVRENQSVMQDTLRLLKSIEMERHDERLLREKNHEILKRINPGAVEEVEEIYRKKNK